MIFKCKYCDREFSSRQGCTYHENRCIKNEHSKKANKLYIAKNGDVLDVTNNYILKYKDQVKKCEICGINLSDMHQGNALCVDHDHTTRKFRGLLCIRCNLSVA